MIKLKLKKYPINHKRISFIVPFDADHYIDAETDWAEEQEFWVIEKNKITKDYIKIYLNNPIFDFIEDDEGNITENSSKAFMFFFEEYINHYFDKHREEYELKININPFKEIKL